MQILQRIKQSNANLKLEQVMPYIQKGQRVLDFGCGDLSLSKAIAKRYPRNVVTGVDVVDFGTADDTVRFAVYDGNTLPYKKNAFDVVISYHVLHHTNNPLGLLSESMRVCGKTLLLVEPVPRFYAEIVGMTIMDWIFNIWKSRTISMTYAFQSNEVWTKEIEKHGFQIKKRIDVELLPKWMPTGRSYLYVCTKV